MRLPFAIQLYRLSIKMEILAFPALMQGILDEHSENENYGEPWM